MRHFPTLVQIAVLLVVTVVGCSPPAQVSFVASEEVAKLPDVQRQQIEELLVEHFGTAASPKFMVPAESGAPGAASLVELVPRDRIEQGKNVYNRHCAGCHGVTGDGNGEAAAYLNPRPRDYRRGVFKFTSTPYGAKPRRQDLVRTIRYGAKGTSMPSFRWMFDEDLAAVVDYVRMLSQRGELEYRLSYVAQDYEEDELIDRETVAEMSIQVRQSWDDAVTKVVFPQSAPPPYSDQTIQLGRQAFLQQDCSKCHGIDGRGQTEWLSPQFIARQVALPESQRIQINYDAWGHAAPAADLTAGMLHGGRRPIDVYRRIYSGINGTPMPGFAQQFSGANRETIWHMVHFVISLTEGREFATPAAPSAGVSSPAASP
jgi:mono/diheme cytochrome c family protein